VFLEEKNSKIGGRLRLFANYVTTATARLLWIGGGNATQLLAAQLARLRQSYYNRYVITLQYELIVLVICT
jgi:hypothetical protein